MIRLIKSIEKAYCSSCGEHLPNELFNIEITAKVVGGVKGTEVCGMCRNCLLELRDKITNEIENIS